MAKLKKIKFGEPVDVRFSMRDRQPILDHTFADPELPSLPETHQLDTTHAKNRGVAASP